MESTRDMDKTCFGQICRLFKCNVYALRGNLKVTKELALARMYQEIRFHQLLERPKLRWSQNGQVSMLIKTIDVLRVVQVTPHFEKEGSLGGGGQEPLGRGV